MWFLLPSVQVFVRGLVEYLLVYRASAVQEVRVLLVRVSHQWVNTAILVQGPEDPR